ncbi:hypothetical protein GP486_006117 [Trichoglossum hirsutum]|uniref:Heterokaryon incompatibility domain-containing protein n=1 Tax=Trichoglossum hirsutum TaxID=265104 RepID=A0A9P8L7Y3_9PEZI|nr:hypothetical protein GP486_006117 [Trichoglossum hirsutum]
MANGEPPHHVFTAEELTEQQAADAMQLQMISSMASRVQAITTQSVPELPHESITLDRCRACSDCFQYTDDGLTTKVIVGIPKTPNYRTASYVWGDTKPLPLQCLGCGSTIRVPMESAEKFRQLAGLVLKSGDSIWIDALSIDQSDPSDIATQLAVMGDIYSNASSVGVLLPKSDGEGFILLGRINGLATTINKRSLEFSRNEETVGGASLSEICQEFYRLLEEYEQNLDKWLYWHRAWTFQEWALARDISLAWEGSPPRVEMSAMKSTILHAATLLAVYKLQQHQYATIKLGFSRGEVPRRFEAIRQLFPDEHAFSAPDGIDEKEVQFDEMMPNLRFGSTLGLRLVFHGNRGRFERNPPIHEAFCLNAPLPSSGVQRQYERLSMMLNALGTSKREARFEADLVACWASMCNIKYDYKKEDSFGIALQKALKALRKDLGIPIYSFLVNTRGASGEVDLKFLEYATAHKQSNASNGKAFHGTPVFTGRADTIIHLRAAISQPTIRPCLKGDGVALQRVKHSSVLTTSPLTDTQATIGALLPATSGASDNMMFYNVLYSVADVLVNAPKEQLQRNIVVAPKFRIKTEALPEADLTAWAICSTDVAISNCFVAREGLNGTLVLAMRSNKGYEVVAYLTLTDQQSGTHLIKVSDHGEIDMTFRTPMRGDLINSAIIDDRVIKGSIELEESTLIAF